MTGARGRGRDGGHDAGAGILGVGLAATMVAATFFQFALGAFAPQIASDVELSIADVGLVTGTLFCLAVPVSLVAGRVVDRLGARRALAIVLGAASVAIVLLATAGSRAALLVAVVPASFAMAGCTPVTNRLAREASGPRTRNLLVAVAQTGVQLGALTTGLLVLLGPRLGWRPLIASLVAVVVLAGFAAGAGQRPRAGSGPTVIPGPGAQHGPPLGDHAGSIAVGPAGLPVGAFTLFAVCMSMPGGATVAYLATFLSRETAFGPAAAGATASVYGIVALLSRASLGRLLPPERSVRPALATTSIGGAMALLAVAAAPAHPGLAWAGAATFGATGLTWPAILMMSVVRRTEMQHTASVTGTILAAFYLGSWLGPLAAGWLLEAGAPFTAVWRGGAVVYLAALLPLVRARAATGSSV